MGQNALEVAFQRRRQLGHQRHFGHRECAVHGVHCTHQGLRDRLAPRCQVGIDRIQMAGDLGLEDVKQHSVDGRDGNAAVSDDVFRVLADFLADFLAKILCDLLVGRHGLFINEVIDLNRTVGNKRLARGRHIVRVLDRNELRRLGGFDLLQRNQVVGANGRFCHGDRRGVHDLLASGDAVCRVLHRLEVGTHAAFAAQSGQQLRQHLVCAANQSHYGLGRLDGVVQHAVEHVFDPPTELTQGDRTHQAAAALEGVEHAPDRLEPIQFTRGFDPDRQGLGEVVDLLLDLFHEYFPDLRVYFLGRLLETACDRALLRKCRHDRCGVRHLQHALWRRHHPNTCIFGCRLLDGLGDTRLCRCGLGLGRLHQRCSGIKSDRMDRLGYRRDGICQLAFHRLCGQRPVTQLLQPGARGVQDAIPARPLLGLRLQVVFEAGQRIGQSLHLHHVRHAPASQQFARGKTSDRSQVVGRFRQLDDAHGADDLVQQLGRLLELVGIPVGFNVGDETLLGTGEVGLRLFHHRLHHAARFTRWHHRGRVLICPRRDSAEMLDLLVQRSLDVQQGSGDIQQGRFVGQARAAYDRADCIALFLHHTTRHTQAEHPESIGYPLQNLDLTVELRRFGVRVAQVQVEGILDPQQIFLDCDRNRVQQRTIVTGNAATRVLDFLLTRQQRTETEHLPQFADASVLGRGMRDEIQQVTGQLVRRIAAETLLPVIGQALDLTLNLADRLLELGARLKCLGPQCLQHPRRHPEQAPCLDLGGDVDQLVAGCGQARKVDIHIVVAEPLEQGKLELAAQVLGALAQVRFRQGLCRSARPGGQFAPQIRCEQHNLGEPRLAACRTQIVEQRQQHDRDILVPDLKPFQVIGQLHDAAHKHGASFILIGDRAFEQGDSQLLHLLGNHRRRIQLDDAQGALDLVQIGRTEADLAGVRGILGVRLQCLPCLLQGLVKFALDPSQRGVVDVVLRPHSRVSLRIPEESQGLRTARPAHLRVTPARRFA